MKFFAVFGVAYTIAGSLFVWAVLPDGGPVIEEAVTVLAPDLVMLFIKFAWWLVIALAIVSWWVREIDLLARLSRAMVVLVATAMIVATFIPVKGALHFAVPYFADPFFADVDLWLHGTDPWRLTHDWFRDFPNALSELVYVKAWFAGSIFFPVYLCLLDGDERRVADYLKVHVLIWVGLGNVAALAGMSVGPVFYDALVGGARFADLHVVFVQNGIADGMTGSMHDMLWQTYNSGVVTNGPAISAFPSVHVAAATMIWLYLAERVPKLWPVSLIMILTYQMLSVHLGWHYAVDGYFSIIVIAGAVYLLRRRRAVIAGRLSLG